MSRRFYPQPSIALVILVLGAFIAAPAAMAKGEVCEEFPEKSQRIWRLGGPQAFSSTPAKSPADLLQQLEANKEVIGGLLEERGLGHLTDKIISAVESGRGLSERPLERGEVFEWMAWRRKYSGPTTTGPLCLMAKKPYSAYEIQVEEETGTTAAKAMCSLKADGTKDGEKMSVDASGSSPGVKVTMTGPGMTKKTIISGGSTTWEGIPEAPGEYTVVAEAQVQGTKTVTTHNFLVPKICVNLAYAGHTAREEPGEADSCTVTKVVEIQPGIPDPECALQAPPEVLRKESFTVSASGEYDDLVVRLVDAEGQPAQARDDAGTRFAELAAPKSIYFPKTGTYTLEGTATNGAGTATCRTTVEVIGPAGDWTLRGFLMSLGTDDDMIMTDALRPDGVSERSKLRFDGGTGLGLGLERRFNDRVGVEGGLLWAELDSSFILDLNNDWERDTDSSALLALVIGPNFHLTRPDSRVDLYIGPFLGWADVGDATYQALGETIRRDFGDDFMFGVQIGADISFGDGPAGLHLGARYMDLAAAQDIGIDPLIGEIGFFYNF